MPIFEYKCGDCGNEFEELVMGSAPKVKCPGCGSLKTVKKMSAFGMSGGQMSTDGGSSGCTSCSKSSCSSCG